MPNPMPNAADKAALKAIAATVIQTCPSLQDAARQVASDLLIKYQVHGLDPDQVYFHRFDASQSSSNTFTGWEHAHATPTSSMTLTQLVTHRFRVTDQDNADLLDVYGGFYTAGPDARTFDERNEVRLHGNDVLKDFWSIDFSALYDAQLNAYWNTRGSDFRTLAKCNFLIKALQARDKRQLSGEDFQFVTQAVIGPLTWPVSLPMLQTSHPCPDSVRTLDIAGYAATNVLRFVMPQGRQILYLPGNSDAFHVLESATDLHFWILQRMNKPAARETFLAHFSLADRQQINAILGDLMNRLVATWGRYDHSMINQDNRAVSGDAFTWLTDSTRTAMFAEASLSLTSNGDLRKKLWIGYLSAGVKVFGPMAVVGWPVALPVIGASIANMGLNIDQAVNGKTAAERKAGIVGAVLNGIDMLFNLLALKGPGSLAEVGPEVDAAEAAEMSDLTDKVGTPMGGPQPPIATPLIEDTPRPVIPPSWQANELLDGITPVSEPGKFQGIYLLDSNPSTAILMDDTAYYVRYEADINGSGHWAVIDPEHPHGFTRSIPVRLNPEGEWEAMPRAGLAGGGKPSALAGSSSRSPLTALPASQYDVPAPLKAHLEEGAAGLNDEALRDFYDSLNEFDAYRDFKVIRKRLYHDALDFFSTLRLPDRPPVPALAADATAEEIIEKILEHARGLVLGESHTAIGSKQWLIENMPLLASKQVKSLYMEHLLTDFHQAALDEFFRTGNMPQKLEAYLKALDVGNMTDPLERYTFLELVKEARKQGIHVQAIDCMASYRLNGMDLPLGNNTARQKMMNYFARLMIRADQSARGAHKWVALMGNSHSNTFDGVAGVSELEEAIGIRVEDVAEGTSRGIEVDPGRILPLGGTAHDRSALVRGDLRLQIETPWTAHTMTEFETLLPRYGMYSLKQQPNLTFIVHRSRTRELVRTVIDTDGKHFYIERPGWPSVSGKRYPSMKALLQALDDMGMQLGGWSKPL
ncbi:MULTISPECIES: membrane-targeted effector domain-containing toxin [Pseudomonas]|uniref:membrane-targeted effector domain-containing toxin n=1 Tax=Pseudomonas TaxID=286 RepID=UPI001FF3308F|nr:membrane-targeted effector domain-containing toxin [Pseudomonas sp. YL2]